jgi:hypothetical protein
MNEGHRNCGGKHSSTNWEMDKSHTTIMNCVDTNVTTNSPRIRRIISKNQSRAAANTLTRRGRDRVATSHLLGTTPSAMLRSLYWLAAGRLECN